MDIALSASGVEDVALLVDNHSLDFLVDVGERVSRDGELSKEVRSCAWSAIYGPICWVK